MAGVTFHEVRFPDDISFGSAGGPGWSTKIIESDSGDETRIARWSQSRRRYNVAYGVKTYANLASLRDFYLARRGPLYGFRFKDFTDCTSSSTGVAIELGGPAVANTNQNLGVGDASNKRFQLVKRYLSGSTVIVRNITKPVSGTVVVALDGVNQTSGWTVDTTTGIVTFTSAPGSGVVVTAGFQFDVPVRFGSEVDSVLRMNLDQYGSGSAQDVPLVEIKDIQSVSDGGEFSYGGSCESAITSDYTLSLGYGRVQYIEAVNSGLKVVLPDATNLPGGAPYFYIALSPSSPNSVDVADSDGSTVLVTLSAGQSVEAILSVDGSGAKHWIVL